MNKQINSLALLAIAGASIMSSCSKDTDLYDSNLALKEYEQNWTEKFGQVASDQDWNTATRANVTVNTASATEVKVYSVSDDTYTLVGDFEGVSGTQKLEFDIAKGVTKLMVNTPSTSFMTTVGGTVDFGGTKSRASHPGTTYGITVADADASLDKELTSSDVFVYRDVLPEGTNNLGKVTQNFNVTSSGKTITLYPIYWQTRQKDEVGVYYKDDSGDIKRIPVYTIKDDNISDAKLLIQKFTEEKTCYGPNNISETGDYACLYSFKDELAACGSSISEDLKSRIIAAVQQAYGSDYSCSFDMYGTNNYQIHIGKYGDYMRAGQYESYLGDYSTSDSYAGKVRTKGINVTIPANTLFGFYITDGSNTFYSESELNPDDYYVNYKKVEGKKACHAAIYKDNDVTYLAFEDWKNDNGGSDMDLNDVVLRVDGVDPTKPEEVHNKDKETSQSWILACEDLGSTDDYDFNDVVFEVSHVAGKNTATITPLAAGGTLKAEIYNGTTLIGEVHDLLVNGTTAESGSYPVLNAGPQKSGYYVVDRSSLSKGSVKSVTLGVDQTFTMANVAGDSKTNMGGFWVKVYKEGETTESVSINAPTNGSVPQMLCISGDLNWAWPIEGTSIEKAYTKFTNWVENTSDSDWYKTPNEVK